MISGVARGVDLYKEARVNNAKKLTLDSRVLRIPNLLVWLETTLESSINKSESSNNALVTTWFDNNKFSAVKNNATQPNPSFKPTYIANAINGLPALSFDGNGDWMTLGNIGGMEIDSKITIFIVFNSYANTRYLIAKQDNYVDGKGWIITSHSPFLLAGNQSSNYIWSGLDVFKLKQNVVLGISYDGSLLNTGIDYYLNGFKQNSGITRLGGPLNYSSSSNGDEDLRIGAREGNTERWFFGLIGEIIIFNSKLSAQEIYDVNQYLIKKWL